MDFSYGSKVDALRAQVSDFMDRYILPAIPDWDEAVASGSAHPEFMEDLKVLARDAGLWNMFLPALGADEPGQALSNLEYAPLAEIMGRVI